MFAFFQLLQRHCKKYTLKIMIQMTSMSGNNGAKTHIAGIDSENNNNNNISSTHMK